MTIQEDIIRSLETNRVKVAIEEDGIVTTYSDLLLNSNKITRFLLDRSVRELSVVGIQSGRITDVITSMIGIMNARCVFVPVDASLPATRFSNIIGELGLSCLLTAGETVHADILSAIPQFSIETILS